MIAGTFYIYNSGNIETGAFLKVRQDCLQNSTTAARYAHAVIHAFANSVSP